jgi:hypothetical protein
VARGYYNNTNILWQKDYFNKTDIGGTKWLSQRTKFLWREATATIQTFCDEKTISTKPILVAPRSYHNGQNICGESLLR